VGSLERVFEQLNQLFESLELDWYIFGAQAVNLYGTPRFTADVDVTVAPPADVAALIERLGAAGFSVDVDDPIGFAELSSVLPARHTETGLPVDIVIGRSGLEADFLRRANRVSVAPALAVPVITVEDLVISKVLAGRPKDLEDARALVAAADELDITRVRGLLEQLEEALGQSDLVRVFDAWLVERGD